MIPLEIGLRVVRGPDWKWLDEDGGDGGLGTVISVRPAGNKNNVVTVVWDIGNKSSCYRVGSENSYDLQVYDSGPIGIKHEANCDTCLDRKAGIIVGSRYTCAECDNLDLCAACYHGDKHDASHIFHRVDTPTSPPVELSPRCTTMKIYVRGFSIGAKVTRGLNWEWENQDGGAGKTGRIVSIEDGKVGKSFRSVAKVLWSVGKENIYRMGSYGKVDLKCVGVGTSHGLYRSHLPVLGQEISTGHVFRKGDRVRVTSDPKSLQHLQQSSKGGWSPQLLNFLGHIGIVHRVTDHKLVRVRFDGCDNKWTFDPRALSKVDPFLAGDFVYFLPDEQKARENLKGHGEWIEKMATDLGNIGIVIQVYADKDVRVAFRKNTFTLSPKCLELVKSSSSLLETPELHNQEARYRQMLLAFLEQRTGVIDPSSTRVIDPSSIQVSDMEPAESTDDNPLVQVVEAVMREVVRGNPAAVHEYLRNPANAVDCPVTGGKTLLHILAYQGCVEELKLVLSRGACIYYPDDAGDTALHYATFNNQPEAIDILIDAGAGINFFNKSKHTPLHVAVFQNFPLCVKALLRHGCDVNIQDNNLDTPLHDAVAKGLEEIVLLLLSHAGVNLYLENSKGFNILNYAVLRGHLSLVEKILERDIQLATKPKTCDGFTPLHVASYNDHLDIVQLLVEKYQVDMNAVDLKNRTPLMLAVGQGSTNVISYFMLKDVTWDVQDSDGNGIIHFLLLRRNNYKSPIDKEKAGALYEKYLSVGGPSNEHGRIVAVFLGLVSNGAPVTLENKKKQKPLDLILDDTSLMNEILEHAQSYISDPVDDLVSAVHHFGLDERRRLVQVPVECAVCSELGVANVLLKPCNHAVACEECSSRMKKCIVCKSAVEMRMTTDGRMVPGIDRGDKSKIERVNYLESKITEIEEMNTCTICMERCRNTIFLCGHGTCDVCAKTLKFCHMCRKLIEQRINVFL